MKKFYRTQREVAAVVNEMIDNYWADKLTDKELEDYITMIYENNLDKIIKNNEYTTIIKQQCGKNRLAVVSKITKIDSYYIQGEINNDYIRRNQKSFMGWRK